MRPGDIVADKYRVDSVIAKGGMGTVYAATHVTLRQRVAIKELLPGAVIVRGASERFLREAQMAALLTSRHVLRILDFGQIDGLPFIVMELLNGHDLASELRRCKKLSVERATDYVLQACVGVAEAHARGIIHRDLKPGNLFLSHSVDGAVEIKVLDFGISKSYRTLMLRWISPRRRMCLARRVICRPSKSGAPNMWISGAISGHSASSCINWSLASALLRAPPSRRCLRRLWPTLHRRCTRWSPRFRRHSNGWY